LFILSVAYLLLYAASYDGEISRADAYRPCAGHVLGFMSTGGRCYEKNDIFLQKCEHVGRHFCDRRQ